MYEISGPWEEEPDKVQWEDESTGMPCLIVRTRGGFLCGYVGVPPSHRYHSSNYTELPYEQFRVHGGLTFAGPSFRKSDPSRGVCYFTEEGEGDNVWWFGFDCDHLGDLAPGWPWTDGNYRDIGYVKDQTRKLAKQLHGVK